MEYSDEALDAQEDLEQDDDSEQLEETDIESDELRDGDVDADGASKIPRRNA